MTILKNEPIYPFKDGDYSKPRHIVVEGTYEEIGFDLATAGQVLTARFSINLHSTPIRHQTPLGDAEPIPGTNHLKDRMSDFYTFGF